MITSSRTVMASSLAVRIDKISEFINSVKSNRHVISFVYKIATDSD